MRFFTAPGSLGLVLIAALWLPGWSAAQGPDASSLSAELEILSERTFFYIQNFPEMPLPPGAESADLEALKGVITAAPAEAYGRIKSLVQALDQVALNTLKRHIHDLGRDVEGQPTNEGNFALRRRVMLEFATILERRKIPIRNYFPEGRAHFFHAIEIPSDTVFQTVDKQLVTLHKILAPEIKESTTTGSGSGGSGGGADTPEVSPGVGPTSTGWEPPKSSPGAMPPPAREDDDIGASNFQKVSRILAHYLLRIAGIVLVLGSLAALCLPRLRGTVRAFIRGFFSGRKTTEVVDEDSMKKILAFVGRGDYRKALSLLDKIDETRATAEWLYWKTLCQFRVLDYKEGIRLIQLLNLDSLPPDAITRLAGVLEECRQIEWCLNLLTHIEKKDPANKTVAQKAANLRRILQDQKIQATRPPEKKDPAPTGTEPK